VTDAATPTTHCSALDGPITSTTDRVHNRSAPGSVLPRAGLRPHRALRISEEQRQRFVALYSTRLRRLPTRRFARPCACTSSSAQGSRRKFSRRH